ncbi:MAG: MerR family transcriptional regulator [Acidobacteria bacterium]|nr:MerR family transcriptional regulator [Acidobacteriota bacterium]MBI3421766.1 MerR family transcriptional regulator [Acidobacteriota bacterium]
MADQTPLNDHSTGFLRAGELARLTGVSTDTLRHYERKGLLKPRRLPNGYRAYPAHAVMRVRLVQCALLMGFKLDELARVFKVRDQGGAPCNQVYALAAAKLAKVEERLNELTVVRDELRELLGDWEQRLETAAPHEPVHLLEDLAATKLVKTGQQALFNASWQTRNPHGKERKQ